MIIQYIYDIFGTMHTRWWTPFVERKF